MVARAAATRLRGRTHAPTSRRYIYFTRIIVFLLAATLPFRYLWLRYVFAEGATLIFYVCTGWMFRPREDNPRDGRAEILPVGSSRARRQQSNAAEIIDGGLRLFERDRRRYLPVKREAEMEEFGLTAGDDDEAGDGTIV